MALREGDWNGAIRLADLSLGANGASMDALLARAVAMRKAGRGGEALAFARATLGRLPLFHAMRYELGKAGGGGDFMRTQRARTVLSLLADKCREMTWDDAKALANNILENNNMTNMNLDDMLQAAEQAYSLKECTMEELRIPVDGAVRAINHANMMAQEVNWPVCREAMYDFLQNSWLVMDDDDDD
jgi:hypothetical protein